jgi:hypothetical protein
VAAARRRGASVTFLLGSKAGVSTKGRGKLVLTLVATGRSAGVGEEERCVLAGVEGDDGAV